ncbi:MAG: hypothetical protein ACRDHZ_13515 [Ktedonobacteraceae bacterium]
MKKTQQVERPNQPSKLPPWPTSQPGPRITKPPAGQKRVLSRTDQVVEVAYDPEQGKSAARTDTA